MLKERPLPFPLDKSIRVIIDTDCYNECDDQFCVTHSLLTPRFDVKAIIAEQFGTRRNDKSEQESYDEIVKLTNLMGIRENVNILHGAPRALSDEFTPIDNEGSRFIIEEAMKDDPRPLFVANIGAVTNLASAYLLEPAIEDKVTAIWIGGGPYPAGCWEPNQNNDIHAARILFKSKIELWQVPMNVYTTMKISYFEMMNKIYPCGKIGKYLVENAFSYIGEILKMQSTASAGDDAILKTIFGTASRGAVATSFVGEQWSLGDSPVVGLMLCNTSGRFHIEDAPGNLYDDGRYDFTQPSSRQIRVYDDIDSHFILNDMIEKLQFYFG